MQFLQDGTKLNEASLIMPPARKPYNFNDTTDLTIVSWLAQYDPCGLPPKLCSAFILGPIQCSLGITQPIIWLANLSCDFKSAYIINEDDKAKGYVDEDVDVEDYP